MQEIPGYVGKIGKATIRGGIQYRYGNRSGAKHYATEAGSRSRTGISVPQSLADMYSNAYRFGGGTGRTVDTEYPTSPRA